jgi:hypothetical protein
MYKASRKLRLSRETLQRLTGSNVQQAMGGVSFRCDSDIESLCSACYCPSNTDCTACPPPTATACTLCPTCPI